MTGTVTARVKRSWNLGRSLACLTALALVGCNGSSSRHAHSPTLAELLAGPSILHTPFRSPSPGEENVLRRFDDFLFGYTDIAGHNLNYAAFVDGALDLAGIDSRVKVEVVDDFRLAADLSTLQAGVSGYEFILMDGKYLDIVSEYSVFLALYDTFQTIRDPVDALDEIVVLHNSVLGPHPDGFTYDYSSLDDDTAELADLYLLDLIGGVILHEYGHIYLLHALEELRDTGNLSVPPARRAVEEDDADLISGMLVNKAGLLLSLGQESLDVATFYTVQRDEFDVTYWDILSVEGQTASFGVEAPLVLRKELMEDGYFRFGD